MTAPSSAKRPSGSPGAKLLITAGALAASLAGWASLTWNQAGAAAGVTLRPLPTLVSRSAASSASRSVANPSPLRGSQPVLRNVVAPPAPVVMTQSSRP